MVAMVFAAVSPGELLNTPTPIDRNAPPDPNLVRDPSDDDTFDDQPIGDHSFGDDANAVTQFISLHAKWFFVGVALLFAISFNGQWRIGLDSANYRGLADGLASGRGYTFGDWAPKNIYPGFPLLLAGLQIVFGKGALAPTIAMLLLSAITLLTTFRLIRLRYPKWIAVTVTCGLATNACFLQQSSELMTDVPFLLGVVTALYGWERLMLDGSFGLHGSSVSLASRASKLKSIALLIAGLSIAALTRPTFLILVIAWAITCAFGILFSKTRTIYAAALTAILIVWIAFAAVDPRSRGFHPLGGGYEREALAMIRGTAHPTGDVLDTKKSIVVRAIDALNDQLPAGFFGEQLSLKINAHYLGKKISITSVLGSLIVIAAPLLLVRRHLLWSLIAWLTVIVTIVVSAEPRYYVMILPILLLGWLQLFMKIAKRFSPNGAAITLGIGLAIVTLNNLSAAIPFIKEQRSLPFLNHYRDGKWMPAVRMAELIRRRIPSNQAVLGPSGSVMSYLSGRHVYAQRELLPWRGGVDKFPAIIAEKNIRFAIYPYGSYRDKEPAIARMMERGIFRPLKKIGKAGRLRLYSMRTIVPKADWQSLKKISAPDWAKLFRSLERKQRVQPRKPNATTQPATRPTTSPTTRPG